MCTPILPPTDEAIIELYYFLYAIHSTDKENTVYNKRHKL